MQHIDGTEYQCKTLHMQVANSPDVNLLDFGVFQSHPEFQ